MKKIFEIKLLLKVKIEPYERMELPSFLGHKLSNIGSFMWLNPTQSLKSLTIVQTSLYKERAGVLCSVSPTPDFSPLVCQAQLLELFVAISLVTY